MKSLFHTVVLLALLTTQSMGQNSLNGVWEGGITIPGGKLKIVFKIDGSSNQYSGTLDIPQQGAIGLPLDPISQNEDSVSLTFRAGQVTGVFTGNFNSETEITGNYSQGGPSTPFSIERTAETIQKPNQPENEKELIIRNEDVEIGGTLTLPDGEIKAPLVIMSSGSGAQNRDSEIYGFRIFSIMAQHLSKQGIPSFRYDDRGVGKSTGNFSEATLNDLTSDINAIISFFQKNEQNSFENFAVLGHSQGGVVAGKIAAENEAVSQLILMGSTAPSLSEILRYQVEFAYSTSPVDESLIQKEIDAREVLMRAIVEEGNINAAKTTYIRSYTDILNALPEAQKNAIPDINAMVNTQTEQLTRIYSAPQTRSLLFYVPTDDLEKVNAPTLVIFGDKDTQVTISQNQAKIREALEQSGSNFEIRIFEDANHLFQKAKTGLASEYPLLEKKFVEGFLEYLSNWIVNNK